MERRMTELIRRLDAILASQAETERILEDLLARQNQLEDELRDGGFEIPLNDVESR
jgi:hypothetical protein